MGGDCPESSRNSTPIHSPPNTDIQQGSSPHTADTQRNHSRTSKAQSSSTSSRRGTSFPTQRNTLLLWMKPLTGVDSNPTSPTSRPSPSIATVLGQKSAAPYPTNISIILFNQQSTTSRLLKCLETLHNDYIHTKQEFSQKLIFNI